MEQLLFLSEGRLNILDNGTPRVLTCQTIEKYKQRGREIQDRNAWKNQGAGAMFTGMYMGRETQVTFPVTGVSKGPDDRIIFVVNFERGGGLYFKSLDENGLETPILVDMNMSFHEVDVNPSGGIAVSTGSNSLERHIALLKVDDAYPQIVTEGDCCDFNPKWSRYNEDVLYYDSAGIGYDGAGRFTGFGPRSIYRLDTKNGELIEVLVGGKYDYYCPFEDANGNLHYIRRPFKQKSDKMTFVDYLKAPGKIFRAIGGWLDFFTRRYSGETLKTSGANPAVGNSKSPHQIFIDGNLLEADKMQQQNANAGDKNPGYAPRDWELVVRTAEGEKVLHKSVMSYCVADCDGSIVYSNGKFVIAGERVIEAHLATGILAS